MMSLMLIGLVQGSLPGVAHGVDDRPFVAASAGFASTWLVQVSGGVPLGPRFRLDAQLDTLLVRPMVGGGRLGVGLSFLHRIGDWAGVGARVEVGVPWAADFTGTWVAVDAKVSARPGVYRPGWSVALDLSLVPVIAASYTPSLVVRDLFGDRPGSAVQGPSEGRLAFPGLRGELGATARVQVAGHRGGPRVWVHASGGVVLTPGLAARAQPTSTLPFVASVGVMGEP